ncbi:hypothetical protein [Paenibacillus sp. SER-28]
MLLVNQKKIINLLIGDKEVLQDIHFSITLDSHTKVKLNINDTVTIANEDKDFTERIYIF